MFDAVLAGGWVVDGTGAPPARADVAIQGDRIVAIGRLVEAPAISVVDCTGRYLMPGFVDAHVHADALVFDQDVQLAALAQGVTTFVVGQDGLSFAPATPPTASYVSEYFGAVNGDWPGTAPSTIADLLVAYDGTSALNVGVLVPHGNLRYEVLGALSRPAERAEITAMSQLAEAAFEQGALGLSSGLDYLPGRFADSAELGALCKVAARYGAPYVTHMRGYESAAEQGISEVRRIAELSGVSPHVSHYHGPANMLTGLIDALRADGTDTTFDSYPYTSGSSILAMIALPARLQADGPHGTIRALQDESIRASLRNEWFEARADELARVRLCYVDSAEYAWAEGLALPAAAAEAGLSVGDFVCDILIAARLRVGCVFRQPPTNTDDDVRALLRHEAHVAGSDGIYLGSKPHPRGWGTFARFLGMHTRDLRDWTWGEASVHLSSHSARRFGLADRGLLRAGYAADIVVIDPAVVNDVATYDDPRRPACGVEHAYVNGALAYTAGKLVSRTSGRGLRRSGW